MFKKLLALVTAFVTLVITTIPAVAMFGCGFPFRFGCGFPFGFGCGFPFGFGCGFPFGGCW